VKTLLAGLLFFALPASAQDSKLPLDDKAKFENSMVERAESVLLRLLGPGRFRVVVDATLDFTRVEKFEIKGGAAKDGADLYLWQNIGAEAVGRKELLPGFPTPEPVPGSQKESSYERSNSFPSEFVKKMAVTVILDESVTLEEQTSIERIIPQILNLNNDRGDYVDVVRAAFAPVWKTIWYQPESVSMLLKYGLIGLMTLLTLIVVAVCFLKLAESMDSMAEAQGQQLQMDFGENKDGEEGEEGEKKEGEEEEEQEPGNKIFFDVTPEQVETLYEILARADSENVALVVAHLRKETKERFLQRLPPALYSEVIMNLGKIKFIEPDTVQTIKEELERRLESAVGGQRQLFTMLDKADMKTKRELLQIMELRDPEMAALIRAKVILFEDIVYLDERDWSILLGHVKIEDWAAGLADADIPVLAAMEKHMQETTWRIIQQTAQATRPTENAIAASQEKVVEVVESLVVDGKIANPAERRPAPEPPPIEEPPALEAPTAVPAGPPGGEEAPPFQPPPGG